jgi:hypothetical protein
VPATLGRDSLLIGAGELAFAEVLSDPSTVPVIASSFVSEPTPA